MGVSKYMQKYFFPIPYSLFPKTNKFLALFKIDIYPIK